MLPACTRKCAWFRAEVDRPYMIGQIDAKCLRVQGW